MDKEKIRKEILAKRKEIPLHLRKEWESRIFHHLQQHEAVQQASTIMLYLSFRGEVGTDDIILWGNEQGKRIVAPRTLIAERKLLPVIIRSPEDVTIGAYGIREPIGDEGKGVSPREIDLIFIPGVAFDKRGGRLGYGGGYYDRFLLGLRRDTLKVGLAYDLQLVDHIPMEAHDIPLDAVVTEMGWHISPQK